MSDKGLPEAAVAPTMSVSRDPGISGSGDCLLISGDCIRESGGERGNSGRSSLNLDCVRIGVPDLARGILVNAEGGICRCTDSLEVFENSEGATRPLSVESLFALVSLRRNMVFQLVENRVLLSESLR